MIIVISDPVICHELKMVMVDINKRRFLLSFDEWEKVEKIIDENMQEEEK